jgi:predicted histone-like DNA-binding protein
MLCALKIPFRKGLTSQGWMNAKNSVKTLNCRALTIVRRYTMSVHYNVISRRNPKDPTAPDKYYGIVKSLDTYSLHQLAERIAAESSLSEADIYATLTAFLKTLPRVLNEGFIVSLGEFGSFRTSISTEGVEVESDFNVANIKKGKIIFAPGPLLKDAISTFKYVKNEPVDPAATT